MNVARAIPETWVLATVGDVCSQPQYGYTTKAADTGDLRLLRTSDITSGRISWETVPYCSDNPADWEKYIVKDGDILVSRAGSVGVSYLVTKPPKAVFASYLIRFKPKPNLSIDSFLRTFSKVPTTGLPSPTKSWGSPSPTSTPQNSSPSRYRSLLPQSNAE